MEIKSEDKSVVKIKLGNILKAEGGIHIVHQCNCVTVNMVWVYRANIQNFLGRDVYSKSASAVKKANKSSELWKNPRVAKRSRRRFQGCKTPSGPERTTLTLRVQQGVKTGSQVI